MTKEKKIKWLEEIWESENKNQSLFFQRIAERLDYLQNKIKKQNKTIADLAKLLKL